MSRGFPALKNVQADALAKIAATLPIKETILLPVHLQTASSIATTSVCKARKVGIEWAHEIENYLQIGDLLEESIRAHKGVQAIHFALIGDYLYK